MTDPIADMLTRIRNGQTRGQETVTFPYSNMKKGILEVLKERNMISNFSESGEGTKRVLSVELKYTNNKPAITSIKRVSKPGRRVYADYRSIPVVKNGYGFVILSTSKGIKDTRTAKHEKVGGEIMCELF